MQFGFGNRLKQNEDKYKKKYGKYIGLKKLIKKYDNYILRAKDNYIMVFIIFIQFLTTIFLGIIYKEFNEHLIIALSMLATLMTIYIGRIILYHLYNKKISNAKLIDWQEELESKR